MKQLGALKPKKLSERQKLKDFCETVVETLLSPELPNEPQEITFLRDRIKAGLKNVSELYLVFHMVDESVCVTVREDCEALTEWYESMKHTEQGRMLH